MIGEPPLEDEVFLVSASLSFALEFEVPKVTKGMPPVFTEDVRCASDLDTTAEEEEVVEHPVVFEEPDFRDVITDTPKIIRTSTRLLIQSLTTLPEVVESQPNVPSDKSEEEYVRPTRKASKPPKRVLQEKQRQSARIRALRTQQREIEQAVKATFATLNNSEPVARKLKPKDRLVQSWRDMYRITTNWMCKLHRREELRKSTFHTFLLNGVNALRKTLNSAVPRTQEVHEITLRFIVDFNKIFEIAQMRGLKEVLGTIGRLVESVLGQYLSSAKNMHPTNLSWIQTKQVMKLLMSVMMRADSAYGLLQLLSRIQMYFISKWAVRPNRNEVFIAYAISQIQLLSSILTGRLEILADQKRYGLQF